MKRYEVRLSPEAEADMIAIYRSVSTVAASSIVALQYINRLTAFLETFRAFPKRGSLRDDIREGLRVVGFERTLSVAFIVEKDSVVILRIGQHGQELRFSEGP